MRIVPLVAIGLAALLLLGLIATVVAPETFGGSRIAVSESSVTVEVLGLDKLFSVRSRIAFPVSSVADVRVDPDAAKMRKGFRSPGTSLPGMTAGTYRRKGEKSFWNIRDGKRAVVIELSGQYYQRVVVEVIDPAATVAELRAAMQ